MTSGSTHGDAMKAPVRVLLIEDDLVDEMALCQSVKAQQFSCQLTVARSLSTARAALAAHPFEIVLADYHLPDGTAFGLLAPRNYCGDSGVILITGMGDEALAVRALQLGAHDYLVKDSQRHYLALVPSRIDSVLRQLSLARQAHLYETRFQTLFEQAAMGIAELDSTTGRFLMVNAMYGTLLGYSVDELLALDFMGTTYPDDLPVGLAEMARLRDGAQHAFTMEKRLVRKDGAIIWVSLIMSSLGKPGQTPLRHMAIIEDITERKQSLAALAASEKKARSIIDSSPVPIALNDQEGRITYLNPSFVEVFGYTLQEIPTLTHWWRLAYPDPAYRQWVIDAWSAELERVTNQTEAVFSPVEAILRCKDGSDKTVLASAARLDRAFQGTHLVILVDITAQKLATAALYESEQRFASLLTTVPGVVWELDPTTLCFTFVSVQAERLLGYPVQQWLNDPSFWTDHLHPEDRDQALTFCLAQTKLGLGHQFEYRMCAADGRTVWIKDIVSVFSQDGRPVVLRGIMVDITAQKLAEERLRERDLRFRAIFDQTFEFIGVMKPDGTLIEANRTALQLSGVREEDVLGKKFWDTPWWAHSLELQDRVREAVRSAAGGTMVRFETTHPSPTGELVHVDFSLKPVHNEQGKVIFLIPEGRDITERKQGEEALRVSEERLRLVIQGTNDGIWDWNLATHALYTSARWNEILGYREGDLPATDTTFFDRLHPDDRLAVQEGLRRHLEECVPHILEIRLRHQDGTYRWCLTRGEAVRDAQGQPIRMLGSLTDVTARRQAEETSKHLRQHLELQIVEMPFGYIVWNAEFRIASWNPAAERIFGYTAEEAIGQHASLLLPEALHSQIEEIWNRLLAGDQTAHSVNENLTKDGRHIICQWTNTPLRIGTGPIIGAFSMVADITAQKQSEAVLAAVHDQIRQMQKMEALGQLAGGIAHDFNNLLAAILGNAELTHAKLATDHPAQPNLARILEASDRASQLVQQILAFTHQQPAHRTVQSVGPVLVEAGALLRATLPAGIVFTVTVDAATPPVLADASQLHQVLMNLCTNAWHAIGDRPGTIAVTLAPVMCTQPLLGFQTTLPPGRYVHLSVRDTGHGMDPETVQRIFEPFFTTKPVGQGTGLGLSVVYGIVERHDGVLLVESQLGQGTTMHLYFPAVEALAPAHAQTDAQPVPLEGRGRHLLLLDDEVLLVEVGQAQLEARGYRVTRCTSPTEAVNAVRADPGGFDGVVTDYNMPEQSGLDVARALAQIRADLPVVLVSGYLSQTVQAAALAAGVAAILPKPVKASQLAITLARLLAAPPQA